ncbi:enoyl-CoA hydratase [Pandoraea terrae]|uniref:Enoyl-CoA hydratase n=1 Tax=Pandoraea terrae TaxID=1537710 RepID=A0A5E4Z1S4_9BURK|nr:enoyl-CoA hydratase [Pandoraea terrae]VVE54270.1 enoyl-CoA hydratase [Pandoraea terrae]
MSDIIKSIAQGVLTITINRAEKRNSITAEMYATFEAALSEAENDREVRVVLITGSEKVFSAGNDLGDFIHNPPASLDSPTWKFVRRLAAFPKPVIAAVCGAAIGIGMTMLLHCDLVFAGENAKFSVPFVDLGLCPEAASSLLLPLRVGHQRASWALLSCEAFDAETAREMGLVNRVLPVEHVFDFANQEAARLVAKPIESLVETKRLMKAMYGDQISARVDEEAVTFAKMLAGDAAKEAIASFQEKRKPDFSRF